LYNAVLHRGASGSEDTAAISMFDTAGATGQANVVTTAGNWARGLFNSSEYTSRPGLTPHDFVYDLYQAFLPYAPDQGGWDWWTSQVGSNWQNKQTVLDAFINAGPYGQTAGTLYREVFWLMPDQLGTPRMIAERTGSLVGIKRHDYLPFGEELFAGQGVRTTTQGYSANESVRQKFTSNERDIETGLDYFGARYYASTQGRFTSADPLLSSGREEEPQSWNRYSYVLNNPLRLVDPLGLYVFDKSVDQTERDKFNAGLATAKANLDKIAGVYGRNSKEYKQAKRALDSYGAEGVKNGVTIFAKTGMNHPGDTAAEGVAGPKTADNPTGQNIHVTFDSKAFDSETFAEGIGHEGSHVADYSDWAKSGFADRANPNTYQFEVNGYTVQSLLAEAADPNHSSSARLPYFKQPGKNPYLPERVPIWKPEWEGADRATLQAFKGNVHNILTRPGAGYELNGTEKAGVKGSRFPR
jgi:RHS repeat-associated protein